jgi:putative tributyrin esterase
MAIQQTGRGTNSATTPSRAALAFLFVTLLASLASHAQTAATAASNVAASGAARVEKVPFESKLTGQSLPYNVVLPPDYDAASSKARRYPVLYLLHGLGSDPGANHWLAQSPHLKDCAARNSLIIVLPEGRDGWYTDGVATDAKFESYVVEELIPDVQRRFRTIESREGRAVAGNSMGGYGALKFALKYPDRFAFAASMSGALAPASWLADTPIPAAAAIRPSVMRVFGPADSAVRAANDIYRIARELPPERVAPLPYLYLDCGTEDRFLPNSRDFAALLVERKIAHEYHQLPGNHGWGYWDGRVQEVSRIAAQRLSPPTRK